MGQTSSQSDHIGIEMWYKSLTYYFCENHNQTILELKLGLIINPTTGVIESQSDHIGIEI